MKRATLVFACLLLVSDAGLAQDGLRLAETLTLQTHAELLATIGDAEQAKAIVMNAVAIHARRRAGSVTEPRDVNVVADQIPLDWLPSVVGIRFNRVELRAARHGWEHDCLRLLWVDVKASGSSLTFTTTDGSRCRRIGSSKVLTHTEDGWRASSEVGSGFGLGWCPCR